MWHNLDERKLVNEEIRKLSRMFITKPVLSLTGLIALISGVISLVLLFTSEPQVFIVGLNIFFLLVFVSIFGMILYCRQPGLIDPKLEVPCFPELKKLAPRLIALSILVLVVINLALLAITGLVKVALPACPEPEGYTFSTMSTEGWQIRMDGNLRLGELLDYSNQAHCRGKVVDSLEFQFQLGQIYAAGQMGLDGKGLPMTAEMSAWVLSDSENPRSLAVKCVVMESSEQGWRWHETPPVELTPGRWQPIDCPANEFIPGGWINPPQFIGLLFYDTAGQFYLGKVYTTSIYIR